MGNDRFQLPKPIAYEENNLKYQTTYFTYVVAGAEIKCSQAQWGKKSNLLAQYSSAETGLDIIAMDIDRANENFSNDFGICKKTGKQCILNQMEDRWHNVDQSMGYINIKTVDIRDNFTVENTPTFQELTKTYPLSYDSNLLCFEGLGLISIAKNGQTTIEDMAVLNGSIGNVENFSADQITMKSNIFVAADSSLIMMSKGGKQNQRDTGHQELSDDEIARGARDPNNPERKRYQKEEKARKQRNKQKRKGTEHSKIVIDWETVKNSVTNTLITIGAIIVIAGIMYVVAHIVPGLLAVLVLV